MACKDSLVAWPALNSEQFYRIHFAESQFFDCAIATKNLISLPIRKTIFFLEYLFLYKRKLSILESCVQKLFFDFRI